MALDNHSPLGSGFRPGVTLEPIVLPTPAPPPRRPPFPLVAAVVPIAAAGVMWLVTGSMFMLLFAALGPLIAVATMVDGARTARRDRRRSAAEAAGARENASAAVQSVHDAERAARWAVEPDAGGLLQRPGDLWRPAAARGESLVVGIGDEPSAARVVGGGDEPDAAVLRVRAATVSGVPVSLPARVGVCVVGPRALASAVVRGLVLQLCLTYPPEQMAIVRAPAGEDGIRALPHMGARGAVRLAVIGPGEPLVDLADVVIAAAAPGAPIPRACGAVLTMSGGTSAILEHGARRETVQIAGVSAGQLADAADRLAEEAAALLPTAPPTASLGDILAAYEEVGDRDPGGLAVPIGLGASGAEVVDLVTDGPHAVVAGVTGSGKSELLVSWVAGLCATRTPDDVCFLLADFKGGTAFDRLAHLPHVTGVITDLDAAGARRAVRSLRAEIRRREHVLAEARARDIRDPSVRLPRLVIVVDEFAALLADHPELHAVFTDVAARGRALGMHLVLGTQRVTGVVRDALLTNCPLRISLRVTDAADSRAVIGTDDAARLAGGVDARGLAFVRRSGDAAPALVRVGLTGASELEDIAVRADGWSRPHRPWLPVLPARVELANLRSAGDDAGALVLGLADEPERQRQPVERIMRGVDRGLAIVGGAGSGKSGVLDLLEVQADPRDVVRVPNGLEAAWDAIDALLLDPRAGTLVLVDDLDALVGALPSEYAAELLARLERIVRAGGAHRMTIVLTAQRLSGPVARIAELLPRRALLPLASRIDHVAAGGDPADFDPSAPPGRAILGGRAVQIAVGARAGHARPEPTASVDAWHPRERLTAIVTRSSAAQAGTLARALPACRVLRLDEVDQAERLGEGLGGAPTEAPVIVVGDPDAWHRHWALWSRARAEGEILVGASCAMEFRAFTARRELPPFAAADDRAWCVSAVGAVGRVRLPRTTIG